MNGRKSKQLRRSVAGNPDVFSVHHGKPMLQSAIRHAKAQLRKQRIAKQGGGRALLR